MDELIRLEKQKMELEDKIFNLRHDPIYMIKELLKEDESEVVDSNYQGSDIIWVDVRKLSEMSKILTEIYHLGWILHGIRDNGRGHFYLWFYRISSLD